MTDETGFFDPTKHKQHICSMPAPEPWSGRGWRCNCGKAYVLEDLTAHDRALGPYQWQWRRSPKHDGSSAQ